MWVSYNDNILIIARICILNARFYRFFFKFQITIIHYFVWLSNWQLIIFHLLDSFSKFLFLFSCHANHPSQHFHLTLIACYIFLSNAQHLDSYVIACFATELYNLTLSLIWMLLSLQIPDFSIHFIHLPLIPCYRYLP